MEIEEISIDFPKIFDFPIPPVSLVAFFFFSCYSRGMKIIKKPVFPLMYHDWCGRFPQESLIFLDIETTGLSPRSSFVYLVGCLTLNAKNSWELTQWLAESPKDEFCLLSSVRDFLIPYTFLVHFNGSRFDLPFLQKRCEAHQIAPDFLQKKELDLLVFFRKEKRFLALPDLKQRTWEKFLGIQREDLYHGRELISLYHNYVRTPSSHLEHLLLLHNEEDLLGLFSLFPLFAYGDLKHHPHRFLMGDPIWTSSSHATKILSFSLSVSLPTPLFRSLVGGWKLELHENKLSLHIPTVSGEMKHFFDHYREYYYLPLEDTAIHQSVAAFVDPGFRQRATRETCYVKKSGLFFPVPSQFLGNRPLFRTSSCGTPYLLWDDSLENDRNFWLNYLTALDWQGEENP